MAVDLLLFITWKAWRNLPLIDARTSMQLARCLPMLAEAERAALCELAIVATHVHVVVEVRPRFDVPGLLQRLKGASARLVNRGDGTRVLLRWAQGYDARTVSRRGLPAIRSYLDRQGEHHSQPLLARWSSERRRVPSAG
jgi:putative transposase